MTTPTFISFAWSFSELNSSGTTTPFYIINGIETPLSGISGTVSPVTLNAGSALTFGITNGVGDAGDLTISNFNATPVPAPLPVLGAAATFGWIRRRRAQLKARQLGR